MRHKLSYFTVIIMLIAMLLSCQQSNNEVPVQEYSTPAIKGTLSLPTGSTVNPAEIYVKVIDSTGATAKVQKANSDKTFVVQGLNSDMSYSILFSSVEPEFTNRAISRDPDKSNGVGGWIHDVKPAIKEGNDIGSVKLNPLGTIRGKALIDGKAEHYDTTVYIPGTSYIAMTNADGTFAIYNVPEGTYTLRYTHDGYMPIMNEGVILTCPEDAENPEITTRDVKLVSSSGTVEGVALFDGLTSHSGITIKLESEDRTKAAQASTSEDGSYVFNGVAPGVYRVIVSASGYVSMSSGYFTVESATLTSVPERTVLYRNVGSVKGTVKLSDSQTDSAGIVVSFVSNEDSFTAVTDKDGYFSRSLKPGAYTVTASYPGYTSQSLDVTVTENALTEINLPSLPLASGAVAGFVVLAGSEDYSGVVITLTNSNAMTESYTAVTAADGSFRFTGLSKGGTYLLTYSKDGYVPDNSKSVDVTVGSVANAGSVTLKSTFATVKGTIQLEGASSYENVTILLKNDKVQYTSTTDQKGGYVINRILPGTYTLLASRDGYVTGQITDIVIEPSSEKIIDTKSLAVAIRSVTGSVTLELLADYSGALVTATNLSDNTLVYSAITNSSGDFTLAGMKPGEYSVVISCNGYRSVTLPTINIVSSSTTKLPVTNMLVNRGTVSGTVSLEGRSSNSGTKIELLRGSEVYAESTTDESGNYSFYVPQGNYSGVRYSKTDFASVSVSRNIALFADNYVSMGDTILKATHNTISGTVDVLTTENEGDVTISFDGVASIPAVTTSANGEFSFNHIPVGSYVMRFRRTDCSDITVPVEVKATDLIDLGIVTITPNTATIKGTVVLKEGLSSEGVTVSIDMGGKTLQTTTDSSGRYEIGGVSIADEYTVTYSKSGWKSEEYIINPKLSPLEIRSIDVVEMVDVDKPVIDELKINNGSTVTSNPLISIDVSSSDYGGSGVSKMMYTWTDSFDSSSWFDYKNQFELYVPENTNGIKTIKMVVKDNAGNISQVVSQNIELVDQVNTVYGTLRTDRDLHWVDDSNIPYVVTADVIVPVGKTLVIDPGVTIYFAGDYSISVRGKIIAIGNKDNPIVFASSGNNVSGYSYVGDWKKIHVTDNANLGNFVKEGVKYTYKDGSIFKNCHFDNIAEGICGRAFVENCEIRSSGYALGNDCRERASIYDESFYGVAINNRIYGGISFGFDGYPFAEKGININASLVNNLIDCEGNCVLFNNYYAGKRYFVHSSTIVNNLITNAQKIEISPYYAEPSIENNTFKNIDSFVDQSWDNGGGRRDHLKYNVFENIKSPFYTNSDYSFKCIQFSNFVSNDSNVIVTVEAPASNTFDWRFNYWGKKRTQELKQIDEGFGRYPSFIDDGCQPGKADYAIIDYDGYVSSDWSFAGYKGDLYSSFEVSDRDLHLYNNTFTVDIIPLGKKNLSYYRYAYNWDSLLNCDWIPLDEYRLIIPGNEDNQHDVSDKVEVFIQCKNEDGESTPIRIVTLNY